MDRLKGIKTYIVAVLVGAVTVAHQLGYIDTNLYQTALALLGGAGLAALRAGVSK